MKAIFKKLEFLPGLMIIVVLFLLTMPCLGQQNNMLGITYYGGSITRPGLGIVYENTVTKRGGHSIGARLMSGYYYHKRLTHNLFILPEGVYRYTFNSGFFLNSLLGIGYQHSFLVGDLYEFKKTEFVKVSDGGRGYLMPSAALGLGMDWSTRKNIPFSAFMNFRANAKYPFNDLWLWSPALETGLLYHF